MKKKNIEDLISITAEVDTFHSFGKKIITSAEDKPQSLDDLAQEDRDGLLKTQNINFLRDLPFKMSTVFKKIFTKLLVR